MKKIKLLATGGTIVSEENDNGLLPVENSQEFENYIDSLRKNYIIDVEVIMNLDSSNIQPEEWQQMARKIFENINDYDGIVLTHGTDTLAYSASMLSFMLQNVPLCVVLTGSQVPINNPLSDAKINIMTAFKAIDYGIKGVSIAFNYKIIKGCRATKVRTMGFNAFESINYPNILELTAKGEPNDFYKSEISNDKPKLIDNISTEVFLLKLIPGTNPNILSLLKNSKYKGIVIEAFGSGGLHFIRRDLLEQIEDLINSGIIIIVCSQCLYEKSDLDVYESGKKILSKGVIQTHDMTTESVVTKLMWALGQTNELNEIKKIFETNYCDEIFLGNN